MKDVMDFLSAALPWICIGLLLAIFFAQNAGKKKAVKRKKTTAPKEWLSECASAWRSARLSAAIPVSDLRSECRQDLSSVHVLRKRKTMMKKLNKECRSLFKDIHWKPMDDIRTEHITRLTKEEWRKMQ